MGTILSIDWDYFADATADERFELFPDGGNERISASLQNIIWISRYADSIMNAEMRGGKGISDISADRDELEQLYTLIEKHKKRGTKMSVHESHKAIADILTKGKFADSSHDVVNIDFHSDCYTTSDDGDINCGNWGSLLSKQGVIDKLYWIRRDDSDDDESGIIEHTYCGIQDLLDSPALQNGIDYIFICRSAVWSPPHLDDAFINMVLNVNSILDNSDIRGLYNLVRRWDSEVMGNIDALANQIRGIIR